MSDVKAIVKKINGMAGMKHESVLVYSHHEYTIFEFNIDGSMVNLSLRLEESQIIPSLYSKQGSIVKPFTQTIIPPNREESPESSVWLPDFKELLISDYCHIINRTFYFTLSEDYIIKSEVVLNLLNPLYNSFPTRPLKALMSSLKLKTKDEIELTVTYRVLQLESTKGFITLQPKSLSNKKLENYHKQLDSLKGRESGEEIITQEIKAFKSFNDEPIVYEVDGFQTRLYSATSNKYNNVKLYQIKQ